MNDKERTHPPKTINDLEFLMQCSDEYDHLKCIISNTKGDVNSPYLLVTTMGFEVVLIKDIDLIDNHVTIVLESCVSGNTKGFEIDLEDNSFQFVLLNVQDVKDMLKITEAETGRGDELLDFQF